MLESKITEEYAKFARDMARDKLISASEDDCEFIGQVMADRHLERVCRFLDNGPSYIFAISEETLLPRYALDEYLGMLSRLGIVEKEDDIFKLTRKGKSCLLDIDEIEYTWIMQALYESGRVPKWKMFLAYFSKEYATKLAKKYVI